MPSRQERLESDRTQSGPGRTGRSMMRGGAAHETPSLTDREMTVLGLLVDGKRNQDISRELAISERTVKFHVSGLFAKLGVSSRTQVVALAQKQGLLEP